MSEVKQLPMGESAPAVEGQQQFENVFHRQFRTCSCEMPMISKKWNDALGTFVALRLCCLAKAVETLTGANLYEVHEFAPRWEWDCESLEQKTQPDGTSEMMAKGSPPAWLSERLASKGIHVANLPPGA